MWKEKRVRQLARGEVLRRLYNDRTMDDLLPLPHDHIQNEKVINKTDRGRLIKEKEKASVASANGGLEVIKEDRPSGQDHNEIDDNSFEKFVTKHKSINNGPLLSVTARCGAAKTTVGQRSRACNPSDWRSKPPDETDILYKNRIHF